MSQTIFDRIRNFNGVKYAANLMTFSFSNCMEKQFFTKNVAYDEKKYVKLCQKQYKIYKHIYDQFA